MAANKAAAAKSKAKPDEPKPDPPDTEKLRMQLATTMEASLQDGSLEKAFSSLKDSKPQADEPDAVLLRIGRALEAGLEDGSLEAAMRAKFEARAQTIVSEAESTMNLLQAQLQAASAPTAPAPVYKVPTPPSDRALRGAAAVMKALSSLDRKIGTLQAGIQETECKIMERTSETAMLEVELEKAQHDMRCLDGELQEQIKAVNAEDLRTVQMQDMHRKLIDDFDNETMKTRHAMLNMDSNCWPARSELSTASTTFGDINASMLTLGYYASN